MNLAALWWAILASESLQDRVFGRQHGKLNGIPYGSTAKGFLTYSDLNDFTGFINAVLTD